MAALSQSCDPLAVPDRLFGSSTPRLFTPPLVAGRPGPCGCGCALSPATSLGFEFVTFCGDVLGWDPLPWQRWLSIHMLELTPDGLFRFRTCLVLVARQNGKTTFAMALALWRMLLDGARMVLGTSTNLDMAKESWEKAVEYAENCAALEGEFKLPPRRANGEVTLTTANGARYNIATADRKGGRSLSVDLLLMDELREHQTWASWSAASKTTNARPRGMKVAITNQGDRTSIVLNHLRAVALAAIGIESQDEQGDIDGIEPDDTLMIAEWSAVEGCELADRQGWAAANPALGYTITERTIASDLTTDDPAVFRTEVLCQRVDLLDAAIDMGAWGSGLDEAMDALHGRIALCLDVALSGNHATLVGAVLMPDGRARAAVVDSWTGPRAAEEALAELPQWRARIKPRAFGWFPGGPSAALAAALKDDKKATALNGEDAPQACMGLAQMIGARRVIHAGDPLLTAQLSGAGKLPQGDKWRFVRLGGPDVDAAYALAGAVHLCRTLPRGLGKPQVHGARTA